MQLVKKDNFNILLIMGNGFDLSCGLKSRYDDFFSWREEKLEEIIKRSNVKENTISKYVENTINSTNVDLNEKLLENLDDEKDEEYKKYLEYNPISSWDCIFVLTKLYISEDYIKEWNDVENIIYNIVTFLLMDKDWPSLRIKESCKASFSEKVKRCFDFSLNLTQAEKSKKMLEELNTFEEVFAGYIENEVQSNELYKISARELIKKLANEGLHQDDIVNVDIFSFNYSLSANQREIYNEYFKNNDINVNINSWYNIHGIASPKEMSMKKSNIIFGIDITDLLNNPTSPVISNDLLKDPRIEFTKSFRIISEHVNKIRDHYFMDDINKIIIYGHSLNKMDYSYFRTIFEMVKLYKSNQVNLELYYYPKDDDESNHTEEKYNISRLINLLVTYSRILGSQYENSIVDKLVLQDRLSIIPTENIYQEVKTTLQEKIENLAGNMHKKNISTDSAMTGRIILSWNRDQNLNDFLKKARGYNNITIFINALKKEENADKGILKSAENLRDYIGEEN